MCEQEFSIVWCPQVDIKVCECSSIRSLLKLRDLIRVVPNLN